MRTTERLSLCWPKNWILSCNQTSPLNPVVFYLFFFSPVFLQPRTAAEAWSTSTTRTQKQTKQRWCCLRQTTATPPGTTASKTASHPPTQPAQIETTSTPPPPLQPLSLLITSRSVAKTINQSVASFIARFPSFCFSSTQVFQNLEVIDSLKYIQTSGWVTLKWFWVSTGVSTNTFLCACFRLLYAVYTPPYSLCLLSCSAQNDSPLVQYSQSADSQHYYWALFHHQMMEEYSCITAAPLPNRFMLPWDHMLLSAIFGSCPDSSVCKRSSFCIPCKASASPVVFLHECFFCSTSLHNVNRTRLPLVPSHAPHVIFQSLHISL